MRTSAAVLWILLAVVPAAAPATFVVDDTSDRTDAFPGDGVCASDGGGCTLRAAVQEVDALAPGPHTINVPRGVFRFTLPPPPGEIDGSEREVVPLAAGGDLDVCVSVTIAGAGRDQTLLDASGLDRLFSISRRCDRSAATAPSIPVVLMSGMAFTYGATRSSSRTRPPSAAGSRTCSAR